LKDAAELLHKRIMLYLYIMLSIILEGCIIYSTKPLQSCTIHTVMMCLFVFNVAIN